MASVIEFLGLNIITLKYFALFISLNILNPVICTFMLSIYLKGREVGGERGGHTSQHIPKGQGPSSKTANMVSLKKQLALRKMVLGGEKKKKKRALIEILFCKHIKSCQLLNILNAHKNVHRWATFLLTLV